MTWAEARDALLDALEGLGHDVHAVPPLRLEGGPPIIVLTPPARTVERRASNIRRTVYRQRIRVMSHLPLEGRAAIKVVADDVDGLVERIDDLLDGLLQIGGHAVSVTAPAWEELAALEYPPGTGAYYAAMDGTISIEVEKVVDPGFRP